MGGGNHPALRAVSAVPPVQLIHGRGRPTSTADTGWRACPSSSLAWLVSLNLGVFVVDFFEDDNPTYAQEVPAGDRPKRMGARDPAGIPRVPRASRAQKFALAGPSRAKGRVRPNSLQGGPLLGGLG